jgi:hypothetical protein
MDIPRITAFDIELKNKLFFAKSIAVRKHDSVLYM